MGARGREAGGEGREVGVREREAGGGDSMSIPTLLIAAI